MKKRGISLIVLVITIIIIIILAGAVILNLNNNNPVDNARRSNVHEMRDSLRSGINLYAAKVILSENGLYKASTLLLGKNESAEEYSIINDYDVSCSITKNNQTITLWQLDYNSVNSKVGLKLENIDSHSRWHIDEYGNPYLVYDALENVGGFLKGEDGKILPTLADFVVVSGDVIITNGSGNSSQGGQSQSGETPQGKQEGSITLSSTSGALTYGNSLDITVTNPNSAEITATSSDETIVSNQNIVITNNNTQEVTISVTALSKAGNVTITITGAEDSVHNAITKTYTLTVWSGEGNMPISAAKSMINSSNIASYIGTAVDYHPAGDSTGVYRIFYLDTDNKYKDGAGTIYLKRDYDDSLKINEADYQGYTTGSNPTETFDDARKAQITASMAKMNPMWAADKGKNEDKIQVIDQRHEYFSSYLCDPNKWTAYKTAEAKYAIGSPSIEMYMDAYNQWRNNNTSIVGPQSYKFGKGAAGYNVGVNGSYPNNGYQNNNSLNVGPNNIFYTRDKCWWLASPSSGSASDTLHVAGGSARVNDYYSATYGVCPVVCLGN